jgi:hypothetical protein
MQKSCFAVMNNVKDLIDSPLGEQTEELRYLNEKVFNNSLGKATQ